MPRQVQLNASFRELWLVVSALGETMWSRAKKGRETSRLALATEPSSTCSCSVHLGTALSSATRWATRPEAVRACYMLAVFGGGLSTVIGNACVSGQPPARKRGASLHAIMPPEDALLGRRHDHRRHLGLRHLVPRSYSCEKGWIVSLSLNHGAPASVSPTLRVTMAVQDQKKEESKGLQCFIARL